MNVYVVIRAEYGYAVRTDRRVLGVFETLELAETACKNDAGQEALRPIEGEAVSWRADFPSRSVYYIVEEAEVGAQTLELLRSFH